MIYPILETPDECSRHIAEAAKNKRLLLNLSQQTLSMRSGVSLAVLKKFERTGKISLQSLLKLALALESLEDFLQLFKQPANQPFRTLDELLKETSRKRGRK